MHQSQILGELELENELELRGVSAPYYLMGRERASAMWFLAATDNSLVGSVDRTISLDSFSFNH